MKKFLTFLLCGIFALLFSPSIHAQGASFGKVKKEISNSSSGSNVSVLVLVLDNFVPTNLKFSEPIESWPHNYGIKVFKRIVRAYLNLPTEIPDSGNTREHQGWSLFSTLRC